jgi:hypothetical protein
MSADNATAPQQSRTPIRQAYQVLLRHQPAANTISYEPHCAACGHKTPCPPRRQAQATRAAHGHNPFPTPAQVETALGLPLVG